MSTNSVDKSLGQRIKKARMELRLSQMEVAQQIGISEDEYDALENGDKTISADLISRLAIALDKPIAWIFEQPSSSMRERASFKP